MYRLLTCCALVAILLMPSLVQAEKPGKTTIAHIGDAVVTAETPMIDEDTGEQIGTKYTVTGYYNVITVSDKALSAHGGHAIEVMGEVFEDIIPYEGTEERHFTVDKFVEVLDE